MVPLTQPKSTRFRTVKAKIRPANPYAILLEPQQRWVQDTSVLRFAVKPRQVGWTWTAACDIVRDKSRNKHVKEAWISSRDEEQARLFLEDCKNWTGILKCVATDLGEQLIDKEADLKAYVMQFANGNRIHSMSSNPDAQAGKRGDRIIDEAALHKDFRKLYAIAKPGITWGGRLSIFSTERGSSTFFHELRTEIEEHDNPKKFSFHKYTLRDFLDYGFLWKLQQIVSPDHEIQEMDEDAYFDYIRIGCDSEESFLQEYMCVAADDSAAFLEWDLIAAAEYRKQEPWQLPWEDCKGDLYMGVDVGRKHDLTVVTILEKLGDVKYTRRMIEMKKAKFADQKTVIWDLLRLPNLRRACFDATGLGMQMAEEARDEFGSRVEEVSFTQPVKADLAFTLRTSFEDRRIRIPHENNLRTDLRAVKKEVTAAGNIRFTADTGPNGHSDRFWSLALAEHAGKTASGPFEHNTLSRSQVADILGSSGKRTRPGLVRGVILRVIQRIARLFGYISNKPRTVIV
jgi:phage FluMu gp28-like protein